MNTKNIQNIGLGLVAAFALVFTMNSGGSQKASILDSVEPKNTWAETKISEKILQEEETEEETSPVKGEVFFENFETEEKEYVVKKQDSSLGDRLTEEEMGQMLDSLWGPSFEKEEISQKEKEDISLPFSEEGGVLENTSKERVNVLSLSSDTSSKEVESIDAEKEVKKVPQKTASVQKTTPVSTPKTASPPKKAVVPPAPVRKEEAPKAEEPIKEAPKPASKNVSGYTDGTYSATGSYKTSSGTLEKISVSITLHSGFIRDIRVDALSTNTQERDMQHLFAADVRSYVLDTHIDKVPKFSAIDGGSYVPKGFSRALESIKIQSKK